MSGFGFIDPPTAIKITMQTSKPTGTFTRLSLPFSVINSRQHSYNKMHNKRLNKHMSSNYRSSSASLSQAVLDGVSALGGKSKGRTDTLILN